MYLKFYLIYENLILFLDNNTAGNFTEKELTKPSYHFMRSNLYA